MQIQPVVTAVVQNPAVQTFVKQVAVEVAAYGMVRTFDALLDRAASAVAEKIVAKTKEQENQ